MRWMVLAQVASKRSGRLNRPRSRQSECAARSPEGCQTRAARTPRGRYGALKLIAMLLGVAGPQSAAFGTRVEPPAGGGQPTLGELLQRIESLEGDKATMQGEIDELRIQLGDNWLTEHRAQEIRAIVGDVLADADTRASLLKDEMTAGWSNHFFLASPDGRFRLQLEGQMQFRWVWSFHDEPDRHKNGFELTRTKLGFRGHLFSRDLTYFVRGVFSRAVVDPPEDDGNFVLEDAWVRYHLDDRFSLRFGQFKLPFNRERLVSSARQLAVERSLVNESHNIARSQGLELMYLDGPTRINVAVSDGGTDNVAGGVFVLSEPANSPAFADGLAEFAVTARIESLLKGSWEQFDDFTSPPGEASGLLLGAAVHFQTGESGSASDEDEWIAVTADASFEWAGANAFAAVSYHFIDDRKPGVLPAFGHVKTWGIVVQGGAFFSSKFEAFGRFEFGNLDFDFFLPITDLMLVTVGGNYYFDGHDVKLTADIGVGINIVDFGWDSDVAGWRLDSAGAEPQVVSRIQFQMLF